MKRHAAMLLAVLVVSLAVMFGSGSAAQAWAVPPVPVLVGQTLRSAPASVLARGVGCAASAPLCAGLAIAAVGVTAYATKDSWLPVLQGLMNGPGEEQEPATSTGSCTTTFSNGRLDKRSDGTTAAGWAAFTQDVSRGSGGCYLYPQAQLNYTCQSGVAYSSGQKFVEVWGSGGSFPVEMNLCGGSTVTSVRIGLRPGYAGADWAGSFYWITKGYPEGANRQTGTVTCKAKLADGSLISQVIEDTQVGTTDRVAIPSCADRLGDNWFPHEVKIKAGPEGGYQRDLGSVVTKPDVYQNYGDCFTQAGLVCQVRVHINGQPCTVGNGACTDWQTFELDNPTIVKCRFGSYVVPLSDCNQLQDAYVDSTPDSITANKPDGSPAKPGTSTTTGTGTGTGGGTGSGTSTFPGSGTNPTAPGTTPDGATDPDSQGCFAAAWSWNPVDWVYVPVKCSLLWAFRPSPGFLDSRVAVVRSTWDDSSPAKYAATAAAMVAAPSVSGCGGISVDFAIAGQAVDFTIGAACAGDTLAQAAAVCRVVVAAGVVIAGGFQCLRLVALSIYPMPGAFGSRGMYNSEAST